jgi:hypothetical protein
MEHKSLINKLESLDLKNAGNLQWDQERTWSRLNAQLGATVNKKTPVWKYMVAASIFFLTAFVTAYVMFYNTNSSTNISSHDNLALTSLPYITDELDVNCEQLVQTPICVKQESSISKVEKEKKTKKSTPVIDQARAQLEDIVIDQTSFSQLIEIGEIQPAINSIAKSEVAQIEEIVITEQFLSEVEHKTVKEIPNASILSARPISIQKKRFSIRLLHRKNKAKPHNTNKASALRLFASN